MKSGHHVRGGWINDNDNNNNNNDNINNKNIQHSLSASHLTGNILIILHILMLTLNLHTNFKCLGGILESKKANSVEKHHRMLNQYPVLFSV